MIELTMINLLTNKNYQKNTSFDQNIIQRVLFKKIKKLRYNSFTNKILRNISSNKQQLVGYTFFERSKYDLSKLNIKFMFEFIDFVIFSEYQKNMKESIS